MKFFDNHLTGSTEVKINRLLHTLQIQVKMDVGGYILNGKSKGVILYIL